MIQIPEKILTPFETFLVKRAIPKNYHLMYKKWLRYYLDFCLNIIMTHQVRSVFLILSKNCRIKNNQFNNRNRRLMPYHYTMK